MRKVARCVGWGVLVHLLGAGMLTCVYLVVDGVIGTGWVGVTLAGIGSDPLPETTGAWARVWSMCCTGLAATAFACIAGGLGWLYVCSVLRLASSLKRTGIGGEV